MKSYKTLQVKGLTFTRYVCLDTKTEYRRIVWALNRAQARRVVSRLSGLEPDRFEIETCPFVLEMVQCEEA